MSQHSSKLKYTCYTCNRVLYPMEYIIIVHSAAVCAMHMCQMINFCKKFCQFLNASCLMKEWPDNKNLDIILFAYSREVRKSLFCCSRRKLWALVYIMSKRL